MDKDTKDLNNKQEAPAPSGTERTRNRKVYTPKVDIFENKDSIVLLADMPGVDENGVEVTLEKNILTITGNVEAVRPDGMELAYAEYDTGDYQRMFTISDEVDRDRIDATIKNGVLKIVLHKAESAKVKKIAIKAEK